MQFYHENKGAKASTVKRNRPRRWLLLTSKAVLALSPYFIRIVEK